MAILNSGRTLSGRGGGAWSSMGLLHERINTMCIKSNNAFEHMYVGAIQYNIINLNEIEHNIIFNTAICATLCTMQSHHWTHVQQYNATQCTIQCNVQHYGECNICARIIEHERMIARSGQMSSAAPHWHPHSTRFPVGSISGLLVLGSSCLWDSGRVTTFHLTKQAH